MLPLGEPQESAPRDSDPLGRSLTRPCLESRTRKYEIDLSNDLSPAESLRSPCPRLGNLFLPILRRCRWLKRGQKSTRDSGDFINCPKERCLVRLGRRVKAADLPYELQRSRTDLCVSHRRFEVE